MGLFFLWASLLVSIQRERSLSHSNSTRFKKRSSIPLKQKELEEKLPEARIIGHAKMMTPAMKQKIDAVLDRVKEPETGLSIAQLGLVERLRYSESKKKLSVILSAVNRSQHKCCTVIQGLLLSGILNALTEEFSKEFPDLTIEIL